MIDRIFNKIVSIRTALVYSQSRYSPGLSELPEQLYTYWRNTSAVEFKGIPRDAFFFARAAEGLLEFFECVSRSTRPCGLPSKAADSVWHAWARLAPGHLEQFCRRHFGRAIAHTEAQHMGLHMEEALARTLVAARAIESLPLAGNRVPRLFSLDSRLAMPKGYAWFALDTRVAFRAMDWQGRAEGAVVTPPLLAPAQLLAAGLITQDDYDAGRKNEGWGGEWGIDCSSSGADGGGGCGGGCGGD